MQPIRMTFRSLLYLAWSLLISSTVLAADKTIVIAQIIDLSGPNGAIGLDYVAGITSYFDSINQRGGIVGKQVRFIVRDDRGDPKLAAKAAEQLITKESPEYLIGGIGNEVTQAILATPDFVRSGLVLFAPLTDALPEFGKRAIVWRPSRQQEIQYIFSYFDKLGIKKIGVTYDESSAEKAAFAMVEKEIASHKMQLVGTVQLSSKANMTTQQINALVKAKPDIVISLTDTINTGLFLKTFRKAAPFTFVTGTSMTNLSTLAEIAGSSAMEWTVFSQVVPNPASSGSPIQIEHRKIMQKFRDEPVSPMTLEGFVVGKTLTHVIQAGKDNAGFKNLSKSNVDLGGFQLIHTTNSNKSLSQFVDVALFRRGGKLIY